MRYRQEYYRDKDGVLYRRGSGIFNRRDSVVSFNTDYKTNPTTTVPKAPTSLYDKVADFMRDIRSPFLRKTATIVGFIVAGAFQCVKYAVVFCLCLVGFGTLFQKNLLRDL